MSNAILLEGLDQETVEIALKSLRDYAKEHLPDEKPLKFDGAARTLNEGTAERTGSGDGNLNTQCIGNRGHRPRAGGCG